MDLKTLLNSLPKADEDWTTWKTLIMEQQELMEAERAELENRALTAEAALEAMEAERLEMQALLDAVEAERLEAESLAREAESLAQEAAEAATLAAQAAQAAQEEATMAAMLSLPDPIPEPLPTEPAVMPLENVVEKRKPLLL